MHMSEDTFSDVAAQKIILSNTDRAPDKHFNILNKKFQEKKLSMPANTKKLLFQYLGISGVFW